MQALVKAPDSLFHSEFVALDDPDPDQPGSSFSTALRESGLPRSGVRESELSGSSYLGQWLFNKSAVDQSELSNSSVGQSGSSKLSVVVEVSSSDGGKDDDSGAADHVGAVGAGAGAGAGDDTEIEDATLVVVLKNALPPKVFYCSVLLMRMCALPATMLTFWCVSPPHTLSMSGVV